MMGQEKEKCRQRMATFFLEEKKASAKSEYHGSAAVHLTQSRRLPYGVSTEAIAMRFTQRVYWHFDL